MLQSIRDKTKTWVGFLLAGFLALLFAVWGVQDFIGSGIGAGDTVIEVGDGSVTGREFDSIYRRTIQTRERQLNTAINYARARREGMVRGIIDSVVEETLYSQSASANGLAVSDEVVAADIRGNPMFHEGDRGFDEVRFRQLLSLTNMSEQQYVELRKQEIARNYLLETLGSVAPPPSSYLDRLFVHRNERRIVEIATITFDSIAELSRPTDQDLREIYEANTEAYTAPEYRKVSLMTVALDEIAETIDLDEAEVREEYERRLDEYRQPEHRLVEHILFTGDEAQQTAREAYEAIRGGRDFLEVSREMGDGPPIDLGSVAADDIPVQDLREAAFNMSDPGVSEPVRSPFGWHIVRVTNIAEERVRELSEVRGEIETRLRRRQALREMDDLRIRLEDMLDAGRPLEEIASEIGDEIRTIPAIDREGRNADGAEVEPLPEDDEFVLRVFDFDEGETSDVHSSGDNAMYIMRVDEIVESHLRPLDEVRQDVRSRWEAQQREARARERAERLRDRVRGGTPLEQAAEALGAQYQRSRPLIRGRPSTPEGTGNGLQARAFQTRENEPFVANVEGGVAVANVTEIETAEADRDDDAYRTMLESYRREVSDEVITQYSRYLRQRFPVTVHQDRIHEMLSGGF